jgi:hypothetical protein
MTDPIAELRRALGDRFAIERLLGQGGMGAVYLARDRQLDRPVAWQVLPTEFAAQHDLRERRRPDMGYALAYAHGRVVVHHGIKPDNIMIERTTGRALLTECVPAVASLRADVSPLLATVIDRCLEETPTSVAATPKRSWRRSMWRRCAGSRCRDLCVCSRVNSPR